MSHQIPDLLLFVTQTGFLLKISNNSARAAIIPENFPDIILSISSLFFTVKLILHEFMDGSIKNTYFLFLAKQIGFIMRQSIFGVQPVNQIYGLLSFSNKVDGKSRRHKAALRAERIEATYDQQPSCVREYIPSDQRCRQILYLYLLILTTQSNPMDANNEQILAKCAQAQKFKQQGNKWFKEKEYVKALKSYHQSNLYLTGLIDKESPMAAYSKQIIDEQCAKKVNQLKFSVYMNMSQIYLFQAKYQKAKDVLTKAAAIKKNTKLKYRLGQCLMNLGSLDQAKLQFKEVLAEDPTMSIQVNQHLLKIKQLQKISDAKSKRMYAKFFDKGEQQK